MAYWTIFRSYPETNPMSTYTFRSYSGTNPAPERRARSPNHPNHKITLQHLEETQSWLVVQCARPYIRYRFLAAHFILISDRCPKKFCKFCNISSLSLSTASIVSCPTSSSSHHFSLHANMQVVLTGSTGFIGSEVLAQAVSHPAISSVICITRALPDVISSNPKVKVIILTDFNSYPSDILSQLTDSEACIW